MCSRIRQLGLLGVSSLDYIVLTNDTFVPSAIDTRTPGGLVYRGAATTKADATLSIDDDEYMQLLFGKLTPQRAFIKGLVKVKGNILLLQRLDQLWNRLQKTRRDPELPFFKDLLLTTVRKQV